MEQDLQTQTAVAEAPEERAPASEESATPEQAAAEQADAAESSVMNALLRGGLPPQAQGSASKPDDQDADTEGAEGTDGASASAQEGVKPSDSQQQPGRRGAAAEIARLRADNERLQKALDEANPPPPDASEEARKAAIETERRFRDLIMRDPDTDPIFNEGDNYEWLKNERARRATNPELRRHYETVLEQDRAALYEDAQRREQAFLRGQAEQILTLAELPGVDATAFKAAPYAVQGRMLYDAGKASNEAELKQLREENAQLRREGFGHLRTAPAGGRSSPGQTFTENGYMNTLLRGGRV